MSQSVVYEFHKIDPKRDYEYAVVTLNRPDKANALNAEMITRLYEAFCVVRDRTHCRFMILRGNGKHFCSGADLTWMKQAAQLSYEENLRDAEELAKVFNSLMDLNIPTLVVVKGSTAGGGLGLVACCDFAIASEDCTFSLKEVRVGLLPAIILPFLIDKIQYGALVGFGVSADTISAQEAYRVGLVSHFCSENNISKQVKDILETLLLGSPQAQIQFKRLLKTLQRSSSPKMQLTCVEAIAKARTSEEGQRGLAAVLSKTQADWVQKLPEDWMLS
jgi:methylglutaconyl-CoA hydratase